MSDNTNFKALAQVPIAAAADVDDAVVIETGNSVRRLPMLTLANMLTGGTISVPDETVRQAAVAYANTTFRTIEEDYPDD